MWVCRRSLVQLLFNLMLSSQIIQIEICAHNNNLPPRFQLHPSAPSPSWVVEFPTTMLAHTLMLFRSCKGRLIPKTWRGCLMLQKRQETALDCLPLGLSTITITINFRSSERPTREGPQSNTATQKSGTAFPKFGNSPNATQNRQALSFDSNSRWVPSWTPNSFCHSGQSSIKFASAV